MENKVYVLIKCEIIEVFEDSGCECCGSILEDYNDDPQIIGVFKTTNMLNNKLKQLTFDEEDDIEQLIDSGWVKVYKEKCFYYLEEVELNHSFIRRNYK